MLLEHKGRERKRERKRERERERFFRRENTGIRQENGENKERH
jgi:hypothetical protein